MPLTSLVMGQMMARLLQPIKSQDLVEKRRKKAQCVSNRCKNLFKRKKIGGVRCTLRVVCGV